MSSISLTLIIVVAHFVLQGINGEPTLIESILDQTASQVFIVADPDNLIDENMDNMQNLCNKVDISFLTKNKDQLSKQFTGLALEGVSTLISQLEKGHSAPFCPMLKNGEKDKAEKMIKETNKHVEQGNRVRLGFITVLHNLEEGHHRAKKTIPQLTCYVKKFVENLSAVYPDKEGAKAFVTEVVMGFFGPFIKMLEEKRGPATTDCSIPEQTTNPTEFKHFLIPFFKAVQKIENN